MIYAGYAIYSSHWRRQHAVGALGHVSLELAHVHQFGNFCLRITPVGGGRLLVNTTHFPIPATSSQSLKLA